MSTRIYLRLENGLHLTAARAFCSAAPETSIIMAAFHAPYPAAVGEVSEIAVEDGITARQLAAVLKQSSGAGQSRLAAQVQ